MIYTYDYNQYIYINMYVYIPPSDGSEHGSSLHGSLHENMCVGTEDPMVNHGKMVNVWLIYCSYMDNLWIIYG